MPDTPAPLPDDLGRDRERAQSMLPWAANGSLGDADRRWLDAWLDATELSHPEVVSPLRAELAWLQRTARDVRSNVTLPDPELGLDQLLGRIADEKAGDRRVRDQQRTPRMNDLWSRLRGWLDGHGLQWAGACALLAIAQVATLSLLNRGGSELDPLSGGPGVVEVKGTVLLKVAFAPGAAEADIRRALQAARVRIVDGPSALGLYLLRVKEEDAAEAIRQLTGQPLVVESLQQVE